MWKCVAKLVSEMISISMYSETLFGSIWNLFLREFILIWAIIVLLEWYFRILNKKSVKFSHFYDSSCIPRSLSLLPSTFAFSFAEKFDIIIEFLEAENARSFLHFTVSSSNLCDKS